MSGNWVVVRVCCTIVVVSNNSSRLPRRREWALLAHNEPRERLSCRCGRSCWSSCFRRTKKKLVREKVCRSHLPQGNLAPKHILLLECILYGGRRLRRDFYIRRLSLSPRIKYWCVREVGRFSATTLPPPWRHVVNRAYFKFVRHAFRPSAARSHEVYCSGGCRKKTFTACLAVFGRRAISHVKSCDALCKAPS